MQRPEIPRISLEPPVYFAPRAIGPLTLDGDIRKPFWENVPFTEDFSDISGRDFPTPRFRTRAKICWDDKNLYIAALLEGNEIWAHLRKRDTVVYFDNDFEMFFDPSSSTHHYMELEMNALNTRWDLMLTRPYRDGGHSVSCWDIKGVETAVHIEGALNAPDADNRWWSVEVKIPFAPLMETYSRGQNPPELARCYPFRTGPRAGEFWRVNFSRVQWHVNDRYEKLLGENGEPLPEDNWVWAPTGIIDIHCPEFWGFVFFTERGEALPVPEDERRKLALRRLYYAQHAWYDAHGRFSTDLDALLKMLPAHLQDAPDFPVRIQTTDHDFEMSCPAADGAGDVVLRADGCTWLTRETGPDAQ